MASRRSNEAVADGNGGFMSTQRARLSGKIAGQNYRGAAHNSELNTKK
jgi:hypothetical protein